MKYVQVKYISGFTELRTEGTTIIIPYVYELNSSYTLYITINIVSQLNYLFIPGYKSRSYITSSKKQYSPFSRQQDNYSNYGSSWLPYKPHDGLCVCEKNIKNILKTCLTGTEALNMCPLISVRTFQAVWIDSLNYFPAQKHHLQTCKLYECRNLVNVK